MESNLVNPDKSESSSFEDLSYPNEATVDDKVPTDKRRDEQSIDQESAGDSDLILDILGNDQLVKKILVRGKPNTRPNRADLAKISFEGKTSNGQVVEKKDNITVQVGDVEVIQGLDLALPLMDEGEQAEIKIAARFAYGDIGLDNKVPPNESMCYKITLHSVKPEKDLELTSISDRKTIGNLKRVRGNWWYSRGEHSFAIQCYRRAIEYLDEVEGGITDPTSSDETGVSDAELQDLLEDRVKVYNNMAAAQMKIQAFDAALKSLDHVLRCQPHNVKALFRKGSIQATKGDTNAAVVTFQRALLLDPNSESIQHELQRLQAKTKLDAKHEKNLYKKMLGQPSKSSNQISIRSNNKDDAGNLKTWGYLLGTVAVGIISIAAYRYKYM